MLSIKDDDCDLPTLYWTPNLHKCPYKQRFIAGFARCTTKPLSQILTSIFTAIKTSLQRYCETSYSRSGVDQMWILKNSKDLKDILRSRSISVCNSIKSFDFSTLYTTIPHSQLKERLKGLIHRCFQINMAPIDIHILSSIEMNPTLLKTIQNQTKNIQRTKLLI